MLSVGSISFAKSKKEPIINSVTKRRAFLKAKIGEPSDEKIVQPKKGNP